MLLILSTGFSRQEYWSGVPLPSPYARSMFWNILPCQNSLEVQRGGTVLPGSCPRDAHSLVGSQKNRHRKEKQSEGGGGLVPDEGQRQVELSSVGWPQVLMLILPPHLTFPEGGLLDSIK